MERLVGRGCPEKMAVRLRIASADGLSEVKSAREGGR
jgi:hypothetical protein